MTMDNTGCVVLVPVGGAIHRDCETGLRGLESKGYTVRRVYGYAQIDAARGQMATDALSDGFSELMWIDADIAFDPDDVDRLRAHGLPLVCGIYPKKGVRELACHVVPGSERIMFGQGGGLYPLLYAGTGFLLTHSQVYSDIQEKHGLPTCNTRWGKPMVPYFIPMVVPHGEGHWYLADDFAFCERASQAGYEIMADTTIRLAHIGDYAYRWEDAGSDLPRYSTYDFILT
jgi:hypothetical protein